MLGATYHILVQIASVIIRIVDRRPANLAFDCPHCRQIRMAKKYMNMTYDQNLKPLSSTPVLICQACKNRFNPDYFQPDPSGVYQLKTWNCPKCSHQTPITEFDCASYGYNRA